MLTNSKIAYWVSTLTLAGLIYAGVNEFVSRVALKSDIERLERLITINYLEGAITDHEREVIAYEDLIADGAEPSQRKTRSYQQSLGMIEKMTEKLSELKK